jgi:DNA polymerase
MTASYVKHSELAAALRWQMEMGVDTALFDSPAPQARLQTTPFKVDVLQQNQLLTASPLSGPKTSLDTISPVLTSVQTSKPDLVAVKTLDALRQAMADFDGCALKKTASNLVFADGNPEAKIMIIGEAPGGDEDRMGLPFVGVAGQLLDKMLASIGLDRQHVYITNILPWRPPGNRTPSSEEVALLWPFLRRHIQLKTPQVIFALGGSSAKLLLNTTNGILKLRGQVQKIDFGDEGQPNVIPVLPSLHPAYLLRAPKMKQQAFHDLLALKSMCRG